MRIIVIPGDGIGPEISEATQAVLEAASQRFGLRLRLEQDLAGQESSRRFGTSIAPGLLDRVRAADGLVLGPMSTYEYDEAKGEINPSMYFRKNLDLYANIRPARTYDGMTARAGAFDLVVVRENTEGFYADRNMEQGRGEMLVTPDVAVSLRRITRRCSERISRAAFELSLQRRRQVTIVHKANVLKITDGLFVATCKEVARGYPQVAVDEVIVDAMMARVVRNPAEFDVVVTTNMFGDILSDLTAELSGSLGLGGSINAGEAYAMAQASHGSAPDIAGTDRANPMSLVLSAALLLQWHGRRNATAAFQAAALAIEAAVADAIAEGRCTPDVGGVLGTRATGLALAERIARA